MQVGRTFNVYINGNFKMQKTIDVDRYFDEPIEQFDEIWGDGNLFDEEEWEEDGDLTVEYYTSSGDLIPGHVIMSDVPGIITCKLTFKDI